LLRPTKGREEKSWHVLEDSEGKYEDNDSMLKHAVEFSEGAKRIRNNSSPLLYRIRNNSSPLF
jgi:hypothetical protein